MGKELKQLQSNYKNQLIEDFAYRNDLNQLINRFIQGTNELSANPDLIHKKKIQSQWWFWLLLFLSCWFVYKYLTATVPPPPPEQEMTLVFFNDQFILSSPDSTSEARQAEVKQLNAAHEEKATLLALLGEREAAPLVQFREKESAMDKTLAQLKGSYQQQLELLEEQLLQQFASTTIEYKPNNAVLATSYHPQLEQIAKLLQQANFSLQIEGFTDPSGTQKRNKKLSCKRANGVRDFLRQLSKEEEAIWDRKVKVLCGESKGEMLQGGRKVELRLSRER